MSAHVYHEIYLHLNWHTKDNRPTLTEKIEHLAHDVIRERCRRNRGAYLHGVNGTADHVHVAVNIEPHVTISDLVKDLKGGSSRDVNERLGRRHLSWQRGYGVVSFGRNNLPWVLDYIAQQKEHHAQGDLHERLERITADEEAG